MRITWLGHASFLLESADKKIYIDPHSLQEKHHPADIILISHDHFDHCDRRAVERIRKPHTHILGPERVERKIPKTGVLRPKDNISFGGVRIKAVHSYEMDKGFHRKGEGLGFIIEAEGKRVYHAGDTGHIPEMAELGRVDVALLPIGGRYTMDLFEAFDAVKTIKPAVAIPMHFGGAFGSQVEADRFKVKVEAETKTKVEILGATPFEL